MTFPLDVTDLHASCKRKGNRFYFSLMHLVVQEMNAIENFRYRIENGEVFDEVIQHAYFTDFIEGTDLFKIVRTSVDEDYETFEAHALQVSKKQGEKLFQSETAPVLNTIYVTSFPWARFIHFTYATKLGSSSSVPQVSWSQFVEENGRKILNLSVEVHHGLVDGYHVGLFINQLQNRLKQGTIE